jgi:hypothetical protein
VGQWRPKHATDFLQQQRTKKDTPSAACPAGNGFTFFRVLVFFVFSRVLLLIFENNFLVAAGALACAHGVHSPAL